MTDLFSPYRLGPLLLPNRMVMAPMTRNRAGPGDVPGELNITYYVQRAGAGLIAQRAARSRAKAKAMRERRASMTPRKSTAGKVSHKPCTPPAGVSFSNSGTSAASPILRCSRTAGFPWRPRRCRRRDRS